MDQNRLVETIHAILIENLAMARATLAAGDQPPAALAPAVVPVMSVEMKPRVSQVLPGQMIMPLAWPVDEQHPS
jgi:hypothetical protein